MELKVFEAFAGYGSQLMALKRLAARHPDFKVVPVGISEIDRYALKAYGAVHGEVTNYGDISRIDWGQVPDFDLFTYSFPCTDVSSAGKQLGLSEDSGTRSSLLWECRKAIEAKKPKYLLMENVKALVSRKFYGDFSRWEQWLASLGYVNFCKVLNAKDYGVPQNRERIFVVSILDDDAKFSFPAPFESDRRIKDILEPEVDENYFLTEQQVGSITAHAERQRAKGNGFLPQFKGGADICTTIKAGQRMRGDETYLKIEEYGKGVMCGCADKGRGGQGDGLASVGLRDVPDCISETEYAAFGGGGGNDD